MTMNRPQSLLRRTALVLLALLIYIPAQALADDTVNIIMITNKGEIQLELYPEKAPLTVENFVAYANSGFYDGTIFHRVIPHFMIQGGGFEPGMLKKPTRDPIQNEANNGLSNKRGTLAMARTNDPHSSTAQFFINVQDNMNLDFTSDASPNTWGYTVFGRVTSGMDVVDEIRFTPTTTRRPYSDVPVKNMVIKEVRVVEQDS